MAYFEIPRAVRHPRFQLNAMLRQLLGRTPAAAPRDPIVRMQEQVRREEARLAVDRLLHRARGPF